MKKTNGQIIVFTIIIIFICFLSVSIFTLPSFIKHLDLSNKASIGDAMGGITAPVIGVISSILLYLALTKQTQSNIDQRLKNESDIIFLLFNQLDNELANFYHKYKQGKEEIKYTGLEGLYEFTKAYRYEYDINQFENNEKFTFNSWFQAGQIVLVAETFNLIEQRIQISTLSNEMKRLFAQKLNLYYDCILKYPFRNLSDAFSAAAGLLRSRAVARCYHLQQKGGHLQ